MKKGDVLKLDYTGSEQVINLTIGKYQIECWGASGNGKELSNNTDSGNAGRGGYVKGTISIFKDMTLYAYVGGVGEYSASGLARGGWNGGGCAWATGNNEPGHGGGGATDIRLINGDWDNPQGLLSRIIVAGGGAGGGEDPGDNGGAGGGLTGMSFNSTSYGGTQSSGRNGGVFGKGAHTPNDGGGGGGGWFGGGNNNGSQTIPTSNNTSDTGNSQSGGSGYVLDSSSYKPDGYLGTQDYHFGDAGFLDGTKTMPNPNGDGLITGNLGNGHIRITCLESVEVNNGNAVFVKVNGEWKKSINSLAKVNGEWK